MNVAESLSVNGPRPRLDLKEDNRAMDNTYGELLCPSCNEQNMALMGYFTWGETLVPHLRCQRCFADAIFITEQIIIWRSKKERQDRDHQFIS